MIFDAEAYAEGICQTSAGSTIEVLVDTIDSTIDHIGNLTSWVDLGEEEEVAKDLIEKWTELRTEIVKLEKENGEDTTFGGDDDGDD